MAIRTLITALLLATGLAGTTFARPFEVPADHAALIRLPSAASAIIIGNPAIADATLYDAQTIYRSGFTGQLNAVIPVGATVELALDASGSVIYSSDLVVTPATRDRVEVFRAANKQSYICTPDCEPIPETFGGGGQ